MAALDLAVLTWCFRPMRACILREYCKPSLLEQVHCVRDKRGSVYYWKYLYLADRCSYARSRLAGSDTPLLRRNGHIGMRKGRAGLVLGPNYTGSLSTFNELKPAYTTTSRPHPSGLSMRLYVQGPAGIGLARHAKSGGYHQASV